MGMFVGVLGEVLVSFGVGAAGWSWCDGVGGGYRCEFELSSLSSWFSISATPINVDDAWKGLERYGKSIDSATPGRLCTRLLVVSKPEANDKAIRA